MSPMPKVAVLGTGSLGKEHARIYSELAAAGRVEFVGVFDTAPERARKVALPLGVRAFHSLDELIEACDAASVVTPTSTHFELACKLVERDRHVLVEKPMTDNG